MNAFMNFLKSGLVKYESKLAKLLNVQVLVILGLVFVQGKDNIQRCNMAHVARLQYADDIILWCIVWGIILALCPASFMLWVSAAIVTLFWSNFWYALTAFVSWCIAKRAQKQGAEFGPECWSSIYYLDQIANSNKIQRMPFNHLTMFVRAFTSGKKYITRGFLTNLV